MTLPKAKTFTAVLEPIENGMGWLIARVPFDIAEAWPERRGTRVCGDMDGMPLNTSLMPWKGGSGHFLLVNKKMQTTAKVRAGGKVKIRLEPDLGQNPAVLPPELTRILKGERELRRWFERLNYGMRRYIANQVAEPKTPAARERRAEQVAEWLMLVMEGELETPPILRAAFMRQPLARVGWEAVTAVQRRNHLLGIFHLQGREARERRTAAAVEECVARAKKKSGDFPLDLG